MAEVTALLGMLVGDTIRLTAGNNTSGDYLNGVAEAREVLELRITRYTGREITLQHLPSDWTPAEMSNAHDPVLRELDNALNDLNELQKRHTDSINRQRALRHVMDAVSDVMLSRLEQLG